MTYKNRVTEFIRCKPSDLLDHPLQWRTHSKQQRETLRGILKEVGIAGSLLAYRSERAGGKLVKIDGHLRSSEVDMEWPVLVLDVTDEEADKLLASFDPLSALAGAEKDQLKLLLDGVKTQDQSIQELWKGLAKQHQVTIGNEEEPLKDPQVELERSQELLEKWGTALGQVWEIGRHRVLCGDSTQQEQVKRLLKNNIPFLMITDPPYGVNYQPLWRVDWDQGERHRLEQIKNDDKDDWSQSYLLFPGDVAYVWHASLHSWQVAFSLFRSGFDLRAQIIWKKQNFVLSQGAYHWGHEPCWYGVKKGKQAKWTGDRRQSTIWEIQNSCPIGGKKDDMDSAHAAQKPLECMARPIRNHGDSNDSIYDPFLGVGTTMVAAEQLNRTCYGIELEPKHVAVTLERLSLLGLTPQLIQNP